MSENERLIDDDRKLLNEFRNLVTKKDWEKALDLLHEDFYACWDQFDLELDRDDYIEVLKHRPKNFFSKVIDEVAQYDRWDWATMLMQVSHLMKGKNSKEPIAYLTTRIEIREEQIIGFCEYIAICEDDNQELRRWFSVD